MEQPRPPSQKPPVGLAGVLNGPEENRDSAYFSSVDYSSKRAYHGASLAAIELLASN
jgi:hypothetical protein